MGIIGPFDPWSSKMCTCPKKYSLSPYTGCSHRCLYCYISSYIQDPFNARPKKNFVKRLIRELRGIDRKLPIIMASSSDPYLHLEDRLGLTRETIKILREYSNRFLIVTKSDLVTRDIDLLKDSMAAVSITVTTLSGDYAEMLEPAAPKPLKRLKAIERLCEHNIPCSARIDPIIPGVNSDDAYLSELVRRLAETGVRHVIASTYKAREDSFRRLIQTFPRLEAPLRELYYKRGSRIGGARYLPLELRLKLILKVKKEAERCGMSFASCREGLSQLQSSASCDSTHMIPKEPLHTEHSRSVQYCWTDKHLSVEASWGLDI
ncbi:MAG: radical SAM protein [Candidatus Bathyarchaeia archaeon]